MTMTAASRSREDHPNNAPGVPMMYPVWFENFQVKYLNPMIKPFARYLPGFATIKHRGRTSGKRYETIVAAFRKGNVLAIALGPREDRLGQERAGRGRGRCAFRSARRAHRQSAHPSGRKQHRRAAVDGKGAGTPDWSFRRRHRLTPARNHRFVS